MIDYVLIILIALMAFGALSSYAYFKVGWFKRIYHDLFKWHIPGGSVHFDGCSVHRKCKICGKDIMRDSQGNWF